MLVSCRHASSAIGPGTRRRRRATTPTAVCPSSSNLHRGSTPRWTTCAPRSPARSTSNRAWPCSSPPARGEPSSREDSWPKPWAGSRVPSCDARRCRRCGRVPCSPRRCCTSVAPTSSRWRAWPTPSPRPRRAWATRRWPSPLDQASIFMLMAHDWASAKRRSATALARPGRHRRAPSAPATSRPSWRWRSARWTTPGRCCTRRPPRSTVCPRRHRRSSPR